MTLQIPRLVITWYFNRRLTPTDAGKIGKELRTALKKETESFALLVNHTIPYEVRGMYQDFGWSFADHPIAMLSETHMLNQEIACQMNVYNGDLELQDAIAAELMVEVLNGAGPKRVTVDPEMTTVMENGELRMRVTWKPVEIDNAFSTEMQVDQIHPVDEFISGIY
jgi:hypothetical protein